MLLIYWLWQNISSAEHIFATANEIKSQNVKVKRIINQKRTIKMKTTQVFVRQAWAIVNKNLGQVPNE